MVSVYVNDEYELFDYKLHNKDIIMIVTEVLSYDPRQELLDKSTTTRSKSRYKNLIESERRTNMETFIYVNKKKNIDNQKFEVVETKGKGHPDNICDTLAEKISANYSNYCLDNYRVSFF